jgi:hypothetical protein
MWTRSGGLAVLSALVLCCATARADDRRPEEPDAGFLEFLGSVDRLSEVNPDYLSQGEAGKPMKPTPPPPAPSPPPPRQPLPPSASASAGPTNE